MVKKSFHMCWAVTHFSVFSKDVLKALFLPSGQSHLNKLINKKSKEKEWYNKRKQQEMRRWKRTPGQTWKACLPTSKTLAWSGPNDIDCATSFSWLFVARSVERKDGWKSRNLGRPKKPFLRSYSVYPMVFPLTILSGVSLLSSTPNSLKPVSCNGCKGSVRRSKASSLSMARRRAARMI